MGQLDSTCYSPTSYEGSAKVFMKERFVSGAKCDTNWHTSHAVAVQVENLKAKFETSFSLYRLKG
jgi:hypothetical protein